MREREKQGGRVRTKERGKFRRKSPKESSGKVKTNKEWELSHTRSSAWNWRTNNWPNSILFDGTNFGNILRPNLKTYWNGQTPAKLV